MKKLTLVFSLATFIFSLAITQTTLHGKITDDETGEELIYANVVLEKNGVLKAGITTDFEGQYTLQIEPGIYTLKISYTGYLDREINDIKINSDEKFELNVALQQSISVDYVHHGCCFWFPPIIELDNTTSTQILLSNKIQKAPVKNINDLILSSPGISIDW